MNHKIVLSNVILLILVFQSLSLNAQIADEPTLDEYKIYLNGTVSRAVGTSPRRIMKLDNNGEILLACNEGKTQEQLHSMGIQFIDSQMRVLIDWKLLEFDQNVYKTAIPILGEYESTEFRKILRNHAQTITPELKPDIISLKNQLRDIGKEKCMFTVLYAYIFHDLFWRQFKKDKFFEKPELSIENPFWNGAVWAIYPPPEFSLGTMAMVSKGLTLHINSVPGDLSPKMKSITKPLSQFQLLSSLAKDIAEDKKVDNKNLRETFAPFGLFDSHGKLTTLMINEKNENILYVTCKNLTKKYHDELIHLVDSKSIMKKLGVRTKQNAVLTTFYEFKWILLDQFVKAGFISKPIAITDPDNISPANIKDLIFITETNSK